MAMDLKFKELSNSIQITNTRINALEDSQLTSYDYSSPNDKVSSLEESLETLRREVNTMKPNSNPR